MGLVGKLVSTALVSLAVIGGCRYMDRRVESIDNKIEAGNKTLTEEEKNMIRAVIYRDPRIMANSIRIAMEDGRLAEPLRQVPRRQIARTLNEGLGTGDKIYLTLEFGKYELNKLFDVVYDEVDRRRK